MTVSYGWISGYNALSPSQFSLLWFPKPSGRSLSPSLAETLPGGLIPYILSRKKQSKTVGFYDDSFPLGVTSGWLVSLMDAFPFLSPVCWARAPAEGWLWAPRAFLCEHGALGCSFSLLPLQGKGKPLHLLWPSPDLASLPCLQLTKWHVTYTQLNSLSSQWVLHLDSPVPQFKNGLSTHN